MGSKLFKQFIKKSLAKQMRGSGPPGPPPRQGLQWKPQTHRWIRPRGTPPTPDDYEGGDFEGGEDDYTSNMGEVAYENIRGDLEMEGLEGPGTFANAKDYAEYLASSSLQSIFEIRGESGGEEENYFLDNVGFTDTDENLDAYENALSIQAKEIAELPENKQLYGTENPEEFGGVVNPDSTYEDFLSNVQEAGLQERIPGFLNEYKSDWEARDASVRPEWGSKEWADEVGDVTFDIGFAMPEGGDNEDEELTRAEDWISSAIANSGVEGFEGFGGGGDWEPSDVSNANDRSLMNFFKERVMKHFAGIPPKDKFTADRETNEERALDYMNGLLSNPDPNQLDSFGLDSITPEDPNNQVEDLINWAINEELNELDQKKSRNEARRKWGTPQTYR